MFFFETFRQRWVTVTTTGNPFHRDYVPHGSGSSYPIYKHDDSRTYAPIHVDHDDTYPLSVEIDEEDIEWDEKIVFAISSGVVWLNSFYDADTLSLIIDLMKELDEKHYEDD